MIELLYRGVGPGLLGALLLLGGFSCGPTALAVEVGEARPLDPFGIGANGNLSGFDRPWENEELLAAFKELGLRHLRYPAGTLGNYWDWDIGWIDPTVPDSLMIGWVVENKLPQSSHRYTLENLALLTEATGAAPIFMLNMLSKDLEHSLRNLRRADRLGMPVRYVELGNELYFDLPFPKLRYPTPEDYGRTCERWIVAIRAEFPKAKFAVIGSYLEVHPRQQDWTARVLRHCPSADAVTYHKYTPSGLDGRMVRRNVQPGEEGRGNPYTATRTAPENMLQRQGWEREQLRDPAAYANLLTTARKGARGWREVHPPPELEVWATEFNMRDDSSVVLNSWAQAMLLSVYYGEFYQSPVTVTTIHNLTGSLFGLLYTDPSLTDYLLDQPREVTLFAPTAAGVITSLFAKSSAGASRCRPLRYPKAPVLTDDRAADFPSVAGYWFSGVGEAALLVNYGLTAVTVQVPDSLPATQATTYRAPLERTVVGWRDVDHTTTYSLNGTLTLPPTSITQLSVNP